MKPAGKAGQDVLDRATIGELRRWAAEKMRAAGVAEPELDVRVLLAHALGLDTAQVLAGAGTIVVPVERSRFSEAISRRIVGEPVARIVGAKEFWSRRLTVSRDVLIPRPDTEILVDVALATFPETEAALRVLDLGIGSGALLGAVLLERPRAHGIGVDRSLAALDVAYENLATLGVADRAHLVCGDWASAIGGEFDLVVANPPYVASHEIAVLPREVREHDPLLALDGGPDGLTAYRAILSRLPGLLATGGAAILEIGDGMEREVAALARSARLVVNGLAQRDLSGRPRALVLNREGHKKTLGRNCEPH